MTVNLDNPNREAEPAENQQHFAHQVKHVYRVTYPNGKIYIGMDLTGSANYFGSAPSDRIATDFTVEELRDFTIRREVLWWSETASDSDVRAKEIELIRLHNSNDPDVGYNRWPKRAR